MAGGAFGHRVWGVKLMVYGQKRARGFTIVELMVILCIFGVMIYIAAPNFVGMIRHQRFRELSRSTYTGLVLGRNEAVRQGRKVTCTLGPVLVEVFVDKDGDGEFGEGDESLFVYPNSGDWFAVRQGAESTAIRDGMWFSADDDGLYVIFNSQGYSVTPEDEFRDVVFTVTDNDAAFGTQRLLEVSVAGAVTLKVPDS